MESSQSKNVTVTETAPAEVEITAELPAELFQQHYSKALVAAQKEAEIDGFRKGKAPKDVVEKDVGQGVLMQRAAEAALHEEYPRLLSEHKLQPLGKPNVTITKIAPGSDLGFRITTATMPTVEIGDYKEAAKTAINKNPLSPTIEVSDTELEEVIRNIRLSKALEEKKRNGEEVPAPESLKDNDLPEVTDAFVSTLGEFSSVDDFRTKIREHVKRQKGIQEREKQWTAILDSILEGATLQVPDVLVQHELDKMIAQLKDDIQRAGLTFEQYLSKTGKTEDGLRSEWTENALKRAKTQLVLNRVAADENITADQEVVEAQVKQIQEQYPNAQPEHVYTFVQTQLMNEKTLSFLASLSEKKKNDITKKKKD